MKQRKQFSALHENGEPDAVFRPQLTSLVDVMTILLVFLIQSFSVEGTLVTPAPDLTLPVSTAIEPAKPKLAIEISQSYVLSGGTIIAYTDAFKTSDSLLIPALYDYMIVQKTAYDDSKRAQEVLIQSDREVAFNILKRVMYTCSRAGFVDFSVLVLKEE